MKKNLLIIAGFLLFVRFGFAQNQVQTSQAVNDTANYPYWIQMMQDPNANFFQTQRAFNIYWKDRKITRSSGWKVFKRWEYMMQSRINPDGSLPSPDAVFNAYQEYLKTWRSSTGNWISLGPAQIPDPGDPGYKGLGRLNVVAWHPTDPNKFYVGSPSGGMWHTTDGGITWSTHTDTMPTLGVSAIVVDYSNPEKILIGTGDRDAGDAPGLGVYKSTNGGNNWVPSKTGMDNKTVGRMIQHPTNSLIFLAATSGGVYRSVDGGENWTRSVSGDFKDIHFKPNDPNFVYAAAGADFYRSTDNGISFVKITAGLTSAQRGAIAVTPANPEYVYFLQSNSSSGYKGVYRSTNSGVSFTTRSTSPNILDWSCDGSGSGGQGWYDLAIAASPNNPETVYVGGVDVWKSTDGGSTWVINSHWYGGCSVPPVHADCHFLGYSPVDGQLYAGNDGGVYSTNNSGITWTDHTVGMTIGQIYKLGQAQTIKNKVINGFQDNGTYTLTPSEWVATGGGDGMECAIDYLNGSYTYHTIYYGDIYRRYNNSAEKHIAGNGVYGIDESGSWVTPFILGVPDPKVMFVGYKNIWRCNDIKLSNLTWKRISDKLAGNNNSDLAVLEQSPADPNTLYAVRYDNKLFRTDNCMDDNPLWYDLTSHLPTGGTATDLKAHPTDPNILYMTLAKKVYKSVDKGLTWTDITGTLPNVNLNTITYYKNAPEGLYVGSDAGVYYKDSTMSDWIAFSQGLPANGRITELEIYYDNDSISEDAIRASTYGRGLWGSDMYQSNPAADFTSTKTLIPISCGIDFIDLSSGVPTNFQWTFPGATPSTSNVKNPTNIVYNTVGIYPVTLKVWNSIGTDSITKTNYITVNNTLLPVVDFTADKNVLCSESTVHFTDKTENCPSSWSWQFTPNTVTYLDGTSENSQNPVVQFNQSLTYNVTLTAYNAVGSGTLTKNNCIVNNGYGLPFEEIFSLGFDALHWTISNPDLSMTWDTITVPGVVSGSKAAWMNFYNYSSVNRRDQLISPAMNFTGYSTVTLSFRHAYAQRATLKDSLIVRISTDCGSTWTRIWGMGPDGTAETFVTHPPSMEEFYPGSMDDWCSGSYGVSCYNIDLSPWAGSSNIKVMFEAYNRNGNNLFLNDISIAGPVGSNEIKKDDFGVTIYPNPSTGKLTLTIINKKETCYLSVFNVHGQEVYADKFLPEGGNISKQLDFSSLSKGVYYVRITTETATRVEKIILE